MTRDLNLAKVHAIILAGGFGTRLRSRVPDRPKALADLWGQPFLHHQLDWLQRQGLTKTTVAVHYRARQIEEFIRTVPDNGMAVDCVYEDTPLGTGGAVINVIRQNRINKPILVVNGDTLFKFPLKQCFEEFTLQRSEALLVGAHSKNAARYGKIKSSKNKVIDFTAADGIVGPGVVSAGLYFFRVSAFERFTRGVWSLEKEILPILVQESKLDMAVLDQPSTFLDIGTPDSYECALGMRCDSDDE